MTERHGSGYGEEGGGQRPSGRGAVTERLAREDDGVGDADGTGGATGHDQDTRVIDLTDEAARRDRDDEQDHDRESAGAFEPAAPAADPPAGATEPGSSSIFDLSERAKEEDRERTGYEPAVADNGPAQPRGQTVVTEPAEPRAETVLADPAEPGGQTVVTEPPADTGSPGPLLASLDAGQIRARFLDIQAGFVDEPRQAVEEAGRLVDDLIRQMVDALQGQRGQLAATAAEGSTEDLRLALRAHRQFVDRLLGLAD
jgi:hypothetical protein